MPISSLSDDLLAEILSYLPFETTTKLKSVSTSWRRLISHPRFTSLQQRRLADRAIGFFHCSTSMADASTVYFQPLPTATAGANQPLISSINLQLQEFKDPILSSNNGLFLIGSNTNFSVWDPTTKARISIPQPSGLLCSPDMMLYGLAASPYTDSNSFQVVGVSGYHFYPIFIYTSKRKSWTKQFTRKYVNAHRCLNPAGPALVGGSMYWLRDHSILAFNLKSKQPRAFKLPREDMIMTRANVWFGRVGENVYLVYVSDEDMELWRLEKYDTAEHWKKVMEAVMETESDAWGAPRFFDGRSVAFSVLSAVGQEWGEEFCTIRFYDTCRKEWQGSTNYGYTNSFDKNHCFVPYYL